VDQNRFDPRLTRWKCMKSNPAFGLGHSRPRQQRYADTGADAAGDPLQEG
jgi:hypothetical protein